MSKYYLRVDAVNLAHFVYDTYDISTIRGGSYLLLDCIGKVADQFQGRLHAISTAASQGLFYFDCPDGDDATPEQLQREILAFLDDETGGHATFAITMEKEGQEDFPHILEKLEAGIHRQQWRLPTVAIPDYPPTDQECYLDGWRPGIEEYNVDPEAKNANKISASTKFRREHGRILKHRLFRELLGKEYEDDLCAKDLGALAKDADASQGVLDGKIAFIHVDGNSFGNIRKKLCTTREQRGAFDASIQKDFQNSFLKTLLDRANKEPDFITVDDKRKQALRLEVLLKGGDEMTLVVPAWKGLEVVRMLFEKAQRLSFEDAALSHRAAVIFCHHNMPILQIRRIAEDLLRQTKIDIQKKLKELCQQDPSLQLQDAAAQEELVALVCDRRGNACHYLVLESFDMLGGSLSKFLSEYYRGASYHNLLLGGDEIEQVVAAIRVLKAELAFGKVLEVIACLRGGQETSVNDVVERMMELVPKDRKDQVRNAIKSLTGDRIERWYILADLWNYVTEESRHE